MTTIDDEVLARLRHQANVTSEATIGSIAGVWARQCDLRTLLSSYDEMKGRIDEAVRIMGPFAEAATNLEEGYDRDTDEMWEHPAAMSITAGDLRAAASFVSREKVDGGARG